MSEPGRQEIEVRYAVTAKQSASLAKMVPADTTPEVQAQEDLYFDTYDFAWSDEEPIRKWLRVRRHGGAAQINMKIFEYDDQGKTIGCNELESTVDDFETLRAILKASGLRELVTVRKVRTTWRMDDVQICIDSVDDLGDFVEIEALAPSADYEETVQHLTTYAERLGVRGEQPDVRGYPYALVRAQRPATGRIPSLDA